MKENAHAGPHAEVYWLVHGSNLLRAAPEHLKPVSTATQEPTEDDGTDPFKKAQQAIQGVRNRGTTLFIDLIRSNKRQRHEVDSDEEVDEPDDLMQTEPNAPTYRDHWQVSDDQKTWARIHNHPRRELYVPDSTEDVPLDRFTSERITSVHREPPHPEHIRMRDDWRTPDAGRPLHYKWTGTTTFMIEDHKGSDSDDTLHRLFMPETPDDNPEPDGDDQPMEPETGQHPEAPPPAPMPEAPPAPSDDPPAPEANMPPVDSPTIPEHQQQLYTPPQPGETFQQQRARVDKQETLSFKMPTSYGPVKPTASTRTTPYSKVHEEEDISLQVDVDLTKVDNLPPGWHLENGWLTLDAPQDEWTISGNWLIMHHYEPRKEAFKPTKDNCPIDVSFLAKDRVTNTTHGVFHDRWQRHSHNKLIEEATWTGQTRFKLKANWRQKAKEDYAKASGGFTAYIPRTPAGVTKKGKDQVTERKMSVADRLAFLNAKKKELDSFFQNQVWLYDKEDNASPGRVLKAPFILTWKKNPDGTPRAKARLITHQRPGRFEWLLDHQRTNTHTTFSWLHPEHLHDAPLAHVHQRHYNSLPPRKELQGRLQPRNLDQASL